MFGSLKNGLSSRNGFVRKGSAALLRAPKSLRMLTASPNEFCNAPPVLANSFPKSGTHLLSQLVAGLPDRDDYGVFLASMTSSFQFRERTLDSTVSAIRAMVPGEIVRGHLFFDPQYARQLRDRNVVHYLIYRDPRDVVISEAHYLRDMNRWHKLHPYFRQAESIDNAIRLSITGLVPAVPGVDYPNIAERFARYRGWLKRSDCLAVRYEDLMSDRRPAIASDMARFYAEWAQADCDLEACTARMLSQVAPHKSHTFRAARKAGWQSEFRDSHRRLFADVAGDLLVELDYEADHRWAERRVAVSV